MQVHQTFINYRSQSDTFRFYFIGDVHLGSAMCDESELHETIERVEQDKFARVFLLGDICDYVAKKDWRFKEEGIADWVDTSNIGNSQRRKAVEVFSPIKRKILGAIQGNHELVIEDEFNQAVHSDMCHALGITNLGYMALVRVVFQRHNHMESVRVLLHHGFGGGRSAGADMARFDELKRDYEADWYVMGHTHRRFANKTIQHYITRHTTLGSRVKLIGRSGTFLKTVEQNKFSYSEKAAMSPLLTGSLCVLHNPYSGESIANI